MKIERIRNTVKGSIWGIIEKIAGMLLPFLVRTVMIYHLGMEYLGLNSLFTSILQVLNLTELGFASAAVFSMYKPIAEDDYETVGAILYYLKKIYRYVGIGMLTAGLLLIPFLPHMVKDDVPENINIYILYLVYLVDSASSYFFMGYKTALLNALQCNDVISKIGFATNTVLKGLQCVVLLVTSNYYAYVILVPMLTFVNNLIKAKTVDRKYPQYLVHSQIDPGLRKDIRSRIFPLMSTKLAVVLVNSADTLVISAALGLKETAMYNNYYFIMSSVQALIFVIHNSMLAGVGNSLVVDKKEKILSNFWRLNFINTWVVSFCAVCLLCLYQTFIRIWAGENYILPFGMVILFVIYFYAKTIERVAVIYKDASGIWKQDMFRAYASCIVNVVLNIMTVKYFGLYGVIGSSVFVSLFIDPWIGRTLFKNVFGEGPGKFYYSLAKGACICVVVSGICLAACRYVPDNFPGLILGGIICCIVSNSLLFLFYRKDDVFSDTKEWICSKILKRTGVGRKKMR